MCEAHTNFLKTILHVVQPPFQICHKFVDRTLTHTSEAGINFDTIKYLRYFSYLSKMANNVLGVSIFVFISDELFSKSIDR